MFFDLCCDIDLTDADIRGKHKMTDEQLKLRFAAALHESAHLVAAAACRKTCILYLTIGKPTLKAGGTGSFMSVEYWPDHESLVSLVGYAWEEAYGEIKRGQPDYNRGFSLRHPEVLDDARAFVISNKDLINKTAKTVLRLLPKHGQLHGKPLEELVKQLRGAQGPEPYISGFVNGKLDHAVEY